MISRRHGVPIIVLTDAAARASRAVNGLHIQTFVPNPFWNGTAPRGTLITFVSGDSVTVAEDFDTVVDAFMGDRQDG